MNNRLLPPVCVPLFDTYLYKQFSTLKGRIIVLPVIVFDLESEFRSDSGTHLNLTARNGVAIYGKATLSDLRFVYDLRYVSTLDGDTHYLSVVLIEKVYNVLRYCVHITHQTFLLR